MYILINESGNLSLQDHDSMKGFSIVDRTMGENRSELEAISQPAEDDHYWIDAQAVIDLSPGSTDKQWVEQFWKMLEGAAPYGYANMETGQVKAHVEKSE
ncbi:MAG: hypothetical protein GKR95_16010 [Gammaproteobacteria bacterium]|nr:hypothetical protein [Gammaproteobacteria bacterium]NKB63549.1 hypothetical protein [Gammaproteobacteria bacterium]